MKKIPGMYKLPALILSFLAGAASGGPVLDDRSDDLDLSHQYTGGCEYFVGGGVASFDCNGDLLPELFIAGGASPAVSLHDETAARGASVALTRQHPTNWR